MKFNLITRILMLASLFVGLLGIQVVINTDNAVYALQPSFIESGAVIFQDDFQSEATGWANRTGAGFDWGVVQETGEYRVFITEPQIIAISQAPLANGLPDEFVLQADIRQHVSGSLSDFGSLGIYLATGPNIPTDSMYIFTVVPHSDDDSLNQTFAFKVFDSNGLQTIIQHTDVDPWLKGINEVNRLAIVQQNGTASLYINDVFVGSASIPTLMVAGVYARTFGVPNLNARFDNFTLSQVNEGSLISVEEGPVKPPIIGPDLPDETDGDAVGNDTVDAFLVNLPFEGLFLINANLDRDVFGFTLEQDATLRVDITTDGIDSDLDSIVTLFDDENNQIARNDDEVDGNVDSLLEIRLEPGAYFVQVESFNNLSNGAYNIRITTN